MKFDWTRVVVGSRAKFAVLIASESFILLASVDFMLTEMLIPADSRHYDSMNSHPTRAFHASKRFHSARNSFMLEQARTPNRLYSTIASTTLA